jgi:two-component system alkaline phosphatase synthesis response regulator PhoP
MTKPIALIVEDQKHIAQMELIAVEKAGYEAIMVHDGLVAINKLSEITPKLVVLDLHLPNVSGMEIFDYIRSDFRFQKTWIFLATADDSLAKEMFQKHPCILTLLKPIRMGHLSILASRVLQ